MPDQSNTSPAGVPRLPERLAAGMEEAAADPAKRPSAYIRLVVAGGVHGERYDFAFMADAAGNVESRLRDDLKQREAVMPLDRQRGDPDRFRRLVELVDVAALLRADPPATGFPPDSIVGLLEVSDGEQVERFRFLADEAQAARASARAPEPLSHAVAAVYAAAAEELGVEDPRP